MLLGAFVDGSTTVLLEGNGLARTGKRRGGPEAQGGAERGHIEPTWTLFIQKGGLTKA